MDESNAWNEAAIESYGSNFWSYKQNFLVITIGQSNESMLKPEQVW